MKNKRFLPVAILLIALLCCQVAFGAEMDSQAQQLYDQQFTDSSSQLANLAEDEIKTKDFSREHVLAVAAVMYTDQTESQLANLQAPNLYYCYDILKNTEKNKTLYCLTCLYKPEGDQEYLVESGEFDTEILAVLEEVEKNNQQPVCQIVLKDAAFLMVSDNQGDYQYYPITSRAEKISKKPCDFKTMQSGLIELSEKTTITSVIRQIGVAKIGRYMMIFGVCCLVFAVIRARFVR